MLARLTAIEVDSDGRAEAVAASALAGQTQLPLHRGAPFLGKHLPQPGELLASLVEVELSPVGKVAGVQLQIFVETIEGVIAQLESAVGDARVAMGQLSTGAFGA